MDLKRKIYFSPLGRIISFLQGAWAILSRPFMVYGYYSRGHGKYRKNTRISSSAVILNKKNLHIGDNVWVWHHTIIDATNKVTIGDGCQVGAWVGIFTHSSHIAVRLYGGSSFIRTPGQERKGYINGEVSIGEHSFIGAKATIMPGITIGRGCLIAAGTLVNKPVPDFSIVAGNPGVIRGSTKDMDKKFFEDPEVQECYFDPEAIREYLHSKGQPR